MMENIEQNKLPGNINLPSSDEELMHLIQKGETGHKYSVEDFFRLPERTGYKISPNGECISFLGPFKRRQNLFIQMIGEETITQLTFSDDRNIEGYFWANSDCLLYLKDAGGNENYRLFGIRRQGGEEIDLTPFPDVRIELLDPLEMEDDYVIIAMNKNNPSLFEPYRLNVVTGETKQIATNEDMMEPIASWLTDHHGKLRVALKIIDGTNAALLYRQNEDDDFKEVLRTDFKEELTPLFFDYDNENFCYAMSNMGRDKSAAVKIDLRTGEEVEVLFEHDQVDVSGISHSKKKRKVSSVSFVTDKTHYYFLSKEREKLQDFLEEQLPNHEVAVVSGNKEENIFIIRTYSDRSLGSYYLYQHADGSLTKISEVSPWLDESDMALQKPISYQSRDGLTIHGYLTLPKDYNGGYVPMIINPHGGPWVRDYWGFNPEVQLFASRGFGVLQMNYRGSKGYGKDFWMKSFKQWGRKMQDDVSDGVAWLIGEGIADKDKVAIYGGSYGGYATLAGICFTNDLYCCAIDYVGVSNLFTFMNTMPPYWKPFIAMMYEMVGDPEKDEAQMRAASPAYHVDKITAPLFVIQGANDPRVNIDESDQIVQSLRSRGIDVPYMVKYDEGHGFRNEENKFEVYKAMLGFLKTYL